MSVHVLPQIIVDLRDVVSDDYVTPRHCKRAGALWKTREGEKIRIRDMSDNHLRNTLEFFSKQLYIRQQCAPYPCFQGEMAQDAAESEWLHLVTMELEELDTIFEILSEEAANRGLEWKRYA